jgi:hypothetical protein
MFRILLCQLHAMMSTEIPDKCVMNTQHFDVLEFVVGLVFFAILLICIECILQANE